MSDSLRFYDEAARIAAEAADKARPTEDETPVFWFASVDHAVEAFKDLMPEDEVRRRWDSMIVEDEADG